MAFSLAHHILRLSKKTNDLLLVLHRYLQIGDSLDSGKVFLSRSDASSKILVDYLHLPTNR